MQRLFEILIKIDTVILDQLFQPLVDHCPSERLRDRPAAIAMLPLTAVFLWAMWHLVHLLFQAADELDLTAWLMIPVANQGMLNVCVVVARDQQPGRLNWFREGGFIFRFPILLATIIAIICWGGGLVPGLWWIAVSFMGCQSAPPMLRKPIWVPG